MKLLQSEACILFCFVFVLFCRGDLGTVTKITIYNKVSFVNALTDNEQHILTAFINLCWCYN